MAHKKITYGFVVQEYDTVKGKHICTHQEFIAGDQVEYENMDGEPIDPNKLSVAKKEVYQPFDMVAPVPLETKGMKFICPSCKGRRLECVQDGVHSSIITELSEEGDFNYGEIQSDDGMVDRFQCVDCGQVIKDGKETIQDNWDLVEWIKKHCKQD